MKHAMEATALLLTALLPLGAAETVVRQNFDAIPCGGIPAGWKVGWGKQLDDTIGVVNSGKADPDDHQLQIDRTAPGQHAIYRLQHRYRLDVPEGTEFLHATLEFRLDYQAATDTGYTIELGGPNPRQSIKLVFALRQKGPTLHLYPNGGKDWSENWRHKKLLGTYESGKWYRVRLLLPYGSTAKNREISGVLETYAGDGWKRQGVVQKVPAFLPMNASGVFGTLPEGKGGNALLLDAFTVSPATAADRQSFTVD